MRLLSLLVILAYTRCLDNTEHATGKVHHTGVIAAIGTCATGERFEKSFYMDWTIGEDGRLISAGEWRCNPIQLILNSRFAEMTKTDCGIRENVARKLQFREMLQSGHIVPLEEKGRYSVRMNTDLVGVAGTTKDLPVCLLAYSGMLSGP